MRFSEVITLRGVSIEVGPDGRSVSACEDSDAFFNRYKVGLQKRLAASAEGLRGVVEGQVRSCDYAGQQRAVLNGVEYSVESADDSGEFTRLTLSEVAGDE